MQYTTSLQQELFFFVLVPVPASVASAMDCVIQRPDDYKETCTPCAATPHLGGHTTYNELEVLPFNQQKLQ